MATKKNKKLLISLGLDMDMLTQLLQGNKVYSAGKGKTPDVEISLEENDQPEDMEDALQQIETLWGMTLPEPQTPQHEEDIAP